MEKVKVTKEVAEALEARKKRHSLESTLVVHVKNRESTGWETPQFKSLNELTTEQLACAWLVGYEVEKTPEEKLAEIYKKTISDAHMHDGWNEWSLAAAMGNRAKGIQLALDTLGIHIEGVNA